MQSLINKDLDILHIVEEAKIFFMPSPMVTFSSARKLISYLVSVEFYPLKRESASCKCNWKRWSVCMNVNETSAFASLVTNVRKIAQVKKPSKFQINFLNDCRRHKINHQFYWNEKCRIYLLAYLLINNA